MSEGPVPTMRRGGRPRDASINDAVLGAVRELLAEDGYAATTVQAISKRSGIPISSIYRRWRNRLELIEDAAMVASPRMGAPTGDLRRDLLRFARELRAAYTSPATRAAFPSLLAEYQSGQLGRAPDEWAPISWRPLLAEILDRAGPTVADPAIDPHMVFDLLLGFILVGEYVPTSKPSQPLDHTIDLLCRLVQPR
jgi:AcrR family transcriptional regulator